jgi:MtfA peptidase
MSASSSATALSWPPEWLLGLALAGVITLFAAILGRRSRKQRRRRLQKQALPEAWLETLEKDFVYWGWLPANLRPRLVGHIQVLCAEKTFEACGRLPEVTDRMRVLVAAQASLLLLGQENPDYYPSLYSILMYPGAFHDRGKRAFDVPEEDRGELVGESWHTGSVVLSWDNVLAGARGEDGGMNVVIHEFAHQLDQANGDADGVPALTHSAAYRQWAAVWQEHFESFVLQLETPGTAEPWLDPYAATSEAEFFAVCSEAFFEESAEFESHYPGLYEQLRDYYCLDPARWVG